MRASEWEAALDRIGARPSPSLPSDLHRAGLLVPLAGERGFAFRHAAEREALIRAIPAKEATAMHRCCAEALAACGAPEGRIGRHYLDGDRPALAVAPLLRAVGRALRTSDYGIALAALERCDLALARLDVPAPDDQVRSWLWRSAALRRSGKLAEARAYAERALEQRPGSPEGLLTLARARGEAREHEAAYALLIAARKAAEAAEDGWVEASAGLGLGKTAQQLGDREETLRWFRWTANAFRARGDSLVHASLLEAFVAVHTGELRAGLRAANVAHACAEEQGYEEGVADARTLTGIALLTLGRCDEAAAEAQAAVDIADAIGTPSAWAGVLLRIQIALVQRDWDAARRWIALAPTRIPPDDPTIRSLVDVYALPVHLHDGDRAAAADVLARIEAALPRVVGVPTAAALEAALDAPEVRADGALSDRIRSLQARLGEPRDGG